MGARFTALSLYNSEVTAFIPIRFRVIEIGHGIEELIPGCSALSENPIGDAHNRRGIHPAAEFGKNGSPRSCPASYGFAEQGNEMVLVFDIRSILDRLLGRWFPMAMPLSPLLIYDHIVRRGNCLNSSVWSQVPNGKTAEVTGDVGFVKLNSVALGKESIENR